MKIHLSLLFFIFIGTFGLLAQPTTFNYQAVVRDIDGSLITSQDILFRIDIMDENQNAYYTEVHNVQTNVFGQISLEVGGGTPQSGDFSTIPWHYHQFYLNTAISLDQGATYIEMGQAPLLSVPYALFAASGNQGPPGNGIDSVESLGDTAFIFHFTDGSSYTTPSIAGIDGTGIESVEYLNDTALIFHFTDGTSFTTNSIVGAEGQDGVGITSTIDNGDGTITFFYSDGSSFTTSNLSGAIAPGSNMQTLRHDGNNWVATNAIKTDGENVGIGTDPAISRLLVYGDSLAGDDDPIFEVKNKDGNVVFAVYQNGVEVNVDETGKNKGIKGGFAVGGLTSGKDSAVQYFRVTPDSVRIYLKKDGTKGIKGGFAVGGLTSGKGITEYLRVTPDSTRVYVDNSAKGIKGGFAVGGLTSGKSISEYLRVTSDSTRVYVNNSAKGIKGGFAVGGLTSGKRGALNEYMRVSPDSVRVYIDDSSTKGIKGGFAVGGLTSGKTGHQSFFNVEVDTSQTILPSENRILWYPTKNAFLTGNVLIEHPDSVGTNSMATGYESKAVGNYSQAMGYKAQAYGNYSTAIGKNALANSINSFAFGEAAQAQNEESYAIGREAIAQGFRSFAFGSAGIDSAGTETAPTKALGDYSFAIGQGSISTGFGSIALGLENNSTGQYSIAAGYKSEALHYGSTAIGYTAQALGENGSTAIGYFAKAWGHYGSIAIGGLFFCIWRSQLHCHWRLCIWRLGIYCYWFRITSNRNGGYSNWYCICFWNQFYCNWL